MHQQSTLPFDGDAPGSPCVRCGTPKTAYRVKSGAQAGQRYYRCTPCKKASDADSHQKHRERRNARNSAYYAANRERWSEYWRQRYAANPEPKRAATRARYAANPAPRIASAKQWDRKNPERDALARPARRAVAKAIRDGILTRPDTCEECGLSGVTIQAAHRDYSRPLDVRWLCRSCHSIWDHQEPKTLAHETGTAL